MKAAVKKRVPAKSGRPPRELAAKVDDRILDAAETVFLDRGFEGASIDEIAEVARAGKPTIYARHAGKRDLFTAVVLRNVARALQIGEAPLEGATTEDRLRAIATAILRGAMSPAMIGLFRVTLAEAHRFPELAAQVSHLGRERGIGTVARVLGEAEGTTDATPLPTSGSDNPLEDARIFMDLVVLPMIMRRLFGESAEALEAEIPRHVVQRVAMFLAMCRTGGGTATTRTLASDRGTGSVRGA